jgi:hypothetical protein
VITCAHDDDDDDDDGDDDDVDDDKHHNLRPASCEAIDDPSSSVADIQFQSPLCLSIVETTQADEPRRTKLKYAAPPHSSPKFEKDQSLPRLDTSRLHPIPRQSLGRTPKPRSLRKPCFRPTTTSSLLA